MFGGQKPFGTSTGFGTSAFGTTPSTPFGQTSNVFGGSAFGTVAPSTSTGLFGSTPQGGGLFGSSTSTFGQPATSATPGFGFGSPATSTSLFGTNTAQPTGSTGLFGTPSNTFGQPRSQFGSFASTAPASGGLFGQPQQQSTNLFGQTGTASTGLFGSSAFGAGPTPTGTTIKFKPLTGTDTMMKNGVSSTINTSHQCITCMKEYESKSLEELRLEDYAANRKGAQGGMVGGFGATTQSSLFSTPATQQSAFSFGGNQAKPLFGGTNTSTSFNTAGTSLFGQTNQTQNIFGKTTGFGTQATSTGSTFGSGFGTAAPAFGQTQQKPLFGQPTSTGLFGATTTTPSTGFGNVFGTGFGATTQANAFGAKAPFGAAATSAPSAFSFGANTTTGSSLFGAKTPAFSFGNTTQSGFGTGTSGFNFSSAANTGAGLFGAQKTAPAFGTGTTPAFGTSGFGTSGFGSTLGGTSTGTGLFGGLGGANKPTFGFGAANTGSAFGGFGTTGQTTTPFNFSGATPALGMTDQNANQVQMQQAQMQQLLLLTSNPYGDNPLFRNLIKDTNKRAEVLNPTSPAAQKSLLSPQYKVSSLPATKIKPKAIVGPSSNKAVSLFHGLEDEESSHMNETFVPRPSLKKLVLKPKEGAERSFSVAAVSMSSPAPVSPQRPGASPRLPLTVPITVGSSDTAVSSRVRPMTPPPRLNLDEAPCSTPSRDSPVPASPKSNLQSLDDTVSQLGIRNNRLGLPLSPTDASPGRGHAQNDDSILAASESSGSAETTLPTPHPTGIVLTRPGYFTIPSLDDLATLVGPDKRCVVEGFTVARDGYGNVYFPGRTDVTGLNLDEIVHFRRKEVTIYPDDEDKPPIGEGLNKKAQVTLDCVWPNDKATHEPIKDPERLKLMGYQDKLERATARIDAKFVEYRPETGSWVFEVKHFSKYGLQDSDDDMEVVAVKQTSEQKSAVDKAARPPETRTDTAAGLTGGMVAAGPGAGALGATLSESLDRDTDMPFAPDSDSPSQANSGSIVEPTSPTTQQLAEALGVSTERVQGMKASFFMRDDGDDEEEYGMGLPQSKLKRALASSASPRQPLKSLFCLPALRTSDTPPASQLVTDAAELPTITRRSAKEVPKPPSPDFLSAHILLPTAPAEAKTAAPEHVALPSSMPALVPFSQSCTHGKQQLWIDATAFMGHSFRVGWGPKLAMVHAGPPIDRAGATASEATRPTDRTLGILSQRLQPQWSSVLVLENVSVSSQFSYPDAIQKENLAALLEVQLSHSLFSDDDGCPAFVPKPGVEALHAYEALLQNLLSTKEISRADSSMMAQLGNICGLCVALWGDIPGCKAETEDPASYMVAQARREALSEWLIQTTRTTIDNEITELKYEEHSHVKVILSFLSGHQVSEACTVARAAREHRLCLLIAQGSCNPITRGILQKQLDNWKKFKVDEHIDSDRLLVYAILAGLLVWHSSAGMLNGCRDLDWKRALAMHLWYHCQTTASIADAVAAYEASFKGSDSVNAYARPPYPPYVEEALESLTESEKAAAPYDACFHLLKLYGDRAQPLDQILTPVTSVPSLLDFRISWVLHSLLTSFGYLHMAPAAQKSLHSGFACQLEAWDMWPWAAFVLLHIQDPNSRSAALRDLLLRHADSSPRGELPELSEEEMFLNEKLHVPLVWIYEAKAAHADSVGDFHAKALFLIKAELWNEAHRTILEHLSTDAIINERHDYLRGLLTPLSQNSAAVLNWSQGGQVFLDFLDVCNSTERILSQEAGLYELEKIRPKVMSLCGRILALRNKTARERLCQAEMAKRTSSLLQAMVTLQEDPSKCGILHLLIPKVGKLPMPEDYTVDEFHLLSTNYLQPHM